jgi:hypothetical protein
VTEEIPEYELHSEPKEFDWFFDIYIQGSNTTFLELSLKFSRSNPALTRFQLS